MRKAAGLGIAEIREAARTMLGLLDERSRRILDARYGLTRGEPQTLQAVGDSEHLTRERIRQIEASATASLRAPGSALPELVLRARAGLRDLLSSLGGATTEQTLVDAVGGGNGQDRCALRFVLSTLPDVTEASETQRTYVHWTLADTRNGDQGAEAQTLEGILEVAAQLLQRANRVLPEKEFLANVREAVKVNLTEDALRSLLGVGKIIVRTPFGEWGLKGWVETTPRSAGDKAYVVLKRFGKPLHFTAVAAEINRVGFTGKRVHPQTVHNELIRSKRFVLVGRGIYGLREWGFEPGTVADVLVRVLSSANRPMSRQDLIDAALKQRLVKRNTVLLALQNRSLFRDAGNGMYALAPTAAATPRAGRGASVATADDTGNMLPLR